jgi:hypothetical protein
MKRVVKYTSHEFQRDLFNLVNDQLSHCGEMYDLPRDPHDTLSKDELEFDDGHGMALLSMPC